MISSSSSLRASIAGVALLLIPSAARAEPPPAEPPARDTATPAPAPDPWATSPRAFLYSADPSAPPPGHVLASLSVGYAQVDRGAARPFAANVASAGAVFGAGVEVGITRWFALSGEGLLAGRTSDAPGGAGVNGGGMIGASFYPFPKSWPVDLALAGGYLRELGGANGAWGRVSVGGSYKGARFVATAIGSHVFEKGRDGVDIMLTAGATYAVLPILRLGAEYVVQDLEGAWEEEEADGGIRHFLGPIASLELAKRVHLTAGPAFGLSKGSPTVLGRFAAAYAF
jgi:hypothetical protein